MARQGAVTEHKTYALLRWVPSYWGFPAPLLPWLIITAAAAFLVFGLTGIPVAAIAAMALRLAYDWNRDVLHIVRVSALSLRYLDRHRRLRP